MNRKRWMLAAAIAALVLVPPAVGQRSGSGNTHPLAWQYGGKFVTTCSIYTARCVTTYVHGKIVTSYDLGKRPAHIGVFTDFYFTNYGSLTAKLRITLKGSSAFAKTSDKCTNRRVKKNFACRVTVAYKAGSASSAKAVLTGVAGNGTPVSLTLTGSKAGPAAGSIYWVNAGTYGNDGTVETIPSGKSGAITLAPNQHYPYSVVVHGTNVYWASAGTTQCPQSPYCHDGSVNVVPLGGGFYNTLVSGLNSPGSLAVDDTNVYWTDYQDQTVNEAPLAGGDTIVLATGQNSPSSLRVDGTDVYWVDAGDPNQANGTVMKTPIGGGTVTTLVGGQRAPASLAIDSTHVYWVCLGDGTVQKIPLAGGSATLLATGQAYPISVTVDANRVYWTNEGSKSNTGTVKAMPLGGGNAVTLARGQGYPTSVAVDGKYVYWVAQGEFTNNGAVNVVPLGGGKVTPIARNQNTPEAVALAH